MHVLVAEKELELVGCCRVNKIFLCHLNFAFSALWCPYQGITDLLVPFFCLRRDNVADNPYRRGDWTVKEDLACVEVQAAAALQVLQLFGGDLVSRGKRNGVPKLQSIVCQRVDMEEMLWQILRGWKRA